MSQATHRVAHGLVLVSAALAVGCVTPAEFQKLRVRVVDIERGEVGGDAARRERLATLRADLQRLERELEDLRGRVEVSEHSARQALQEARAGRAEAATPAPLGGAEPAGEPELPAGVEAEEVKAYRNAHSAWRKGDAGACIDRFRNFLQTYPASAYADDAAYWMADCYFKNGDFRAAVLRFADVVENYPTGNKAPDALYRQGEALLRLNYDQAARTAFQNLLQEYPDSARAPEAKRQLELLGAG